MAMSAIWNREYETNFGICKHNCSYKVKVIEKKKEKDIQCLNKYFLGKSSNPSDFICTVEFFHIKFC